jgi:hypothetical protein
MLDSEKMQVEKGLEIAPRIFLSLIKLPYNVEKRYFRGINYDKTIEYRLGRSIFEKNNGILMRLPWYSN